MKFAWLLIPWGVLVSCGPTATLFTDEVFRTAAPEVVRAWAGLVPLHDARIRERPPGAGPAWWNAELKSAQGLTALVGAILTPAERESLVSSHAEVHFVFFLPPSDALGQTTITVDRAGAWSEVTRKAAEKNQEPAAALFPADATEEEMQRVVEAWEQSGGRTLSTAIWPGATPSLGKGTVFQWAGAEADPLILALPPNRAVHGNPGTARSPGAGGLTWELREQGLGEFLWSAGQNREKPVSFLPLETVSANR
jgi:hypothetical protein